MFKQLCAPVCVLVLSCACLHPLWLGRETLSLTAPELERECRRQSLDMTNLSGAGLWLNGAEKQSPDPLHETQTVWPMLESFNPVRILLVY